MPDDAVRIIKDFRAMAKPLQGQAFRRAAKSAMLPTFKKIQASTPIASDAYRIKRGVFVTPGFLKRQLRLSLSTTKSNVGARIWVNAPAFHIWMFVSLGTKPHRIPKKQGGGKEFQHYNPWRTKKGHWTTQVSRRSSSAGSWRKKALFFNGRFYKSVNHPGTKANPWVTRIFGNDYLKVEKRLEQELVKQIHKAVN